MPRWTGLHEESGAGKEGVVEAGSVVGGEDDKGFVVDKSTIMP